MYFRNILQELEGLHALVIPGGESTVIVKLLVEFGMFDEVQKFGRSVSNLPL
jgi:glutamine amidotransferase PdxT